MNSIRFGTNPIAWSNDDMRELGAHISLDTCLLQAREAGFEGIELGHKFPRNSDDLRPILQQKGIDLIGGWYSLELLKRTVSEEIEHAQSHIKLLKDMGCKVFIMAETSNAIHCDRSVPLSKSPHLAAGEWLDYSRKISEFSSYLQDNGLLPAYHHHMGTIVETIEEIDILMDSTQDSVGLLFDTGHATFAGVDPIYLAKAYSSRITHVHCKDVRLDVTSMVKEKDLSFLEAVVNGAFTVPGDGNIDFVPILNVLSRARYSGWLVVEAEQDPEKADPEKYAKMGFSNLKSFADAAALI